MTEVNGQYKQRKGDAMYGLVEPQSNQLEPGKVIISEVYFAIFRIAEMNLLFQRFFLMKKLR